MPYPNFARSLAAAALLLATAATGMHLLMPQAHAHGYKLGKISVGHIWAPPPQKDAAGVPVYVPILNNGDAPVELVGATSLIADEARIRAVAKDGTVTWPKAIEFRPGKPFALAKWHQHIWLSGLHEPLKEGDSFELTLDFGAKGKLPVKVLVETSSGH
jgi:periplasmic copper chaperone A